MAPPLQLLDLPSELLLKILSLLPPSSLLTSLRVSKLFHQTYHSSSLLQYIVALHTTHHKDVEGSFVPPSEKLRLLKERDGRWRRLEWKRRQSVVCDQGSRGGSLYDLLGGVLAVAVDKPCRTLRFYKMPSTFGATTVLSRDCVPGIIIKDFTMDPSQDLLILVETLTIPVPLRNRPSTTYRLHLLTLSTFAPHPLASQSTLTFPFKLSTSYASPFISVMDSVVCLHASTEGDGGGAGGQPAGVGGTAPEGGIAVWDWKRGVAVTAQPSTTSEDIESFAFLGPDLFLLAAYDFEEDEAVIQLYTFDSQHTPSPPPSVSESKSINTPSAPPPILLATYQLPPASYRPESMTIRLDPAPGVGDVVPPFAEGAEVDLEGNIVESEGDENVGGSRKPAFQLNNEERLVVVDISYMAPDANGQGMRLQRFTLFALKTFFMKALRHSPPLSTLHQQQQDALALAASSSPSPPPSSTASSTAPTEDAVESVEKVPSMPGRYVGVEGKEEEDEDEGWKDDEHLAVHYPFEDWQEKCRIISDIPLQHAWVLYVYGCKFIHPTGRPLNEEHSSISISPRILDFSPFSVSRLTSTPLNPRAVPGLKWTTSDSIFPVAESPAAAAKEFDGNPAADGLAALLEAVEKIPPPHLTRTEHEGDTGKLIEAPTVISPSMVFENGLRTGGGLPYVERQMGEVMVDELTSLNRETLAAMTIDEQRVVIVKNSRSGELILDTMLF